MAGLAAHHAPAHDAPRALDGNAPLRAFYEDDESHHRDHSDEQDDDEEECERTPGAGLDLADHFTHAAGQTGHDAREDEQAHAIADAAVRDLLAQPHDEGGAGGQRQDRHQSRSRSPD